MYKGKRNTEKTLLVGIVLGKCDTMAPKNCNSYPNAIFKWHN